MPLLIRVLLLAGILCLGMNFLGVAFSYYATLHDLSHDTDSSDALVSGAGQARQSSWVVSGWTVLGVVLIAAAVGLRALGGGGGEVPDRPVSRLIRLRIGFVTIVWLGGYELL